MIDVKPDGLHVVEMVDGLSFEELQRLTGVPLKKARYCGLIPAASRIFFDLVELVLHELGELSNRHVARPGRPSPERERLARAAFILFTISAHPPVPTATTA